MTTAAAIALIQFLGVLVAVGAWARAHGRKGREDLVGRTVIILAKDDKTYRGVVHGVYEDSIALRQVMLVRGDAERALGHEIRLRWANVSSTQVVLAVSEAGA